MKRAFPWCCLKILAIFLKNSECAKVISLLLLSLDDFAKEEILEITGMPDFKYSLQTLVKKNTSFF